MFRIARIAPIAALLVAPAFVLMASADNPPSAVPVRDATEALAALGTVTHLDYRATPYVNVERVLSALTHVGIKRVRDMMPDANAGPYELLAAQGIKFDLVVRGGKIGDLQAAIGKAEALQAKFAGSVSSIEGLNEANLWPASLRNLTGLPAASAVQHELYAALKASPTLRTVPVYALSLGGAGEKEFDALGDLSDAADMGNAHIYFGTRPPTNTFEYATKLARRATPRLQHMVVTETGYASAGKPRTAVNEAVQARYLLMLIAETWRRGTPATFIYQLVDDKLDANDWSRNLGLYRFDWSAKPAAEAVHRLTTAVGEIAAERTGAPCNATIELTGKPLAVNALRLGAAHGCALLLWLDQPLWNDLTNAPLEIAVQPASLALRPMPAGITLIDPLDGSQRPLKPDATKFTLALGDHPLLLRWH
jgi:hypothetical protein